MAEIVIQGAAQLGNGLQQLLLADDIEPGTQPGYQTCKAILTLHPLGAKMAEAPVKMMQSQSREITVANAPGRVVERFKEVWDEIEADQNILNLCTLARAYGIASIIIGAEGVDSKEQLWTADYSDKRIFFNVLDPLNTAGSLVLNQDPNAPDFQKHGAISVNGMPYHRSRSLVMMNEQPVYIDYTSSAFGFVGRSVYQRALYPLKSFVNTMVTDDMVALKAGVIVAMMKQVGSIIDNAMRTLFGVKRNVVKEAMVGNVIGIGTEEKIESLNLQNIDAAMVTARTNILLNCAVAADMPARWLNNETFVKGFGEGTEDAKVEARYVDRLRLWAKPSYLWMDDICQKRAWNAQFIAAMKKDYPELYAEFSDDAIFMQWRNSYKAIWPSLLIEPDSEKIRVAETKFKSVIAAMEVLLPALDPANKASAMQWMADNFNEEKELFPMPLNLDFDTLLDYLESLPPPKAMPEQGEPAEPAAFSART